MRCCKSLSFLVQETDGSLKIWFTLTSFNTVLLLYSCNRGVVIPLIVKSLKNPRSAVCKTAIMTSADIFKVYSDSVIDSFDPLVCFHFVIFSVILLFSFSLCQTVLLSIFNMLDNALCKFLNKYFFIFLYVLDSACPATSQIFTGQTLRMRSCWDSSGSNDNLGLSIFITAKIAAIS